MTRPQMRQISTKINLLAKGRIILKTPRKITERKDEEKKRKLGKISVKTVNPKLRVPTSRPMAKERT